MRYKNDDLLLVNVLVTTLHDSNVIVQIHCVYPNSPVH